ncbi:MAG: hypothetical protein WAT88_03655 [Saprospiraceae bacterium]
MQLFVLVLLEYSYATFNLNWEDGLGKTLKDATFKDYFENVTYA